MQTLEKLTSDQRLLIEQNYDKVYERISKHISKHRKEVEAEEILSFLPDVTLEYVKKKDKQGFVSFATIRCIYRHMCHSRSIGKLSLSDIRQNNEINKTIDKVVKQKGYCSHDDIILSHPDLTERKLHKLYSRFNTLTLTNYKDTNDTIGISKNIPVDSKNFFEDIEWNDLKETLVKRSKKYFEGVYRKSETAQMSQLIVKDWLIPKVEGKENLSIDSIALMFGVTKNRVSQIIHSKQMKHFILENLQ